MQSHKTTLLVACTSNKKERWLVILYRSGKYGINSVANKRLVFTGNLMKSEVLNNKSKITDHWKAGQKVNSVRHNVGFAWFDHSGCALQDYNYANSFELSELQTLRCKIKLRNLKGGCMYLCVNCFVRNCSRLGRGSMRGTCYTSGSLPCDGYPLLFSVTGICCAVFFLFKVRCVL